MIIVGVIGFCGAVFKNYNLLMFFIAVMGVVFLLLLACTIVSLVEKDQISEDSVEQVLEQWLDEDINRLNHLNKAFDCCGAVGPTDYALRIAPLPSSCCTESISCDPTSHDLKQDGCAYPIENLIQRTFKILVGSIFGLIFIVALTILLSFFLLVVIQVSSEFPQKNLTA
ncbi:cd63 antigen [Cichlidogyrus casuarinus]|uniref:Cd63 antigen n=1 Tax=Cichlidogyrus casuarinus TaxID=1844966 RepID=A0ABD2PNN3_9PLAT